MKHISASSALAVIAVLVSFGSSPFLGGYATAAEDVRPRVGHEQADGVPEHPHEGETHDSHSENGDDHRTSGEYPEREGHANEGGVVSLTESQRRLAEIDVVTVRPQPIDVSVTLNGEVGINEDRAVHVASLMPGVVQSVHAFLGDRVEPGTLMAVIHSGELAQAKAALNAARERKKLATTRFDREKQLWQKRISSEQEYLDAQSVLVESRIAERAALETLQAFGVRTGDESVDERSEGLARLEVFAPFAGTVIEKKVAAGAAVEARTPLYRIADLGTVWVIASVYERDIAKIRKGQRARIVTDAYPGRTFEGSVTWVSDSLDEATRTMKVRIEVENQGRLLKPAMFVRTEVVVERTADLLTVPEEALRRETGELIVFVDEGNGRYVRREVEIGRRSGGLVEVVHGLASGERVVSAGSFLLKSELEKDGFGGGHGH